MAMSLIEKQFPVSKLSKESSKERKANNGQTLTGFGKWWGRKPLVLIRAVILGCLMPESANPSLDMEIFLKIMCMDDTALWQRHKQWVNKGGNYWHDKEDVIYPRFNELSYDEKLKICVRPEQFNRPSADPAWDDINRHLGIHAFSLQDLIRQLSEKRFGKNAVIGDCFCGGGSVPFEAARMGLDVYASDLNPIAVLLTWAAIHICGAGDVALSEIKQFQQEVYDAADKEITALGIEHNEKGERALSYLYCMEACCPECGVLIPIAPSWVIGKGTRTVAQLIKNGSRYDIAIKMNATAAEMKAAEKGTATPKGLFCPNCGSTTPIPILRRDGRDVNGHIQYGLRLWEKHDFEPRLSDIYQERLYCIKYERLAQGKGRPGRYYRTPNTADLVNEVKVRRIVAENIVTWQERGVVPCMAIVNGYNTDQLVRERGWTHWHHLFNARQLLLLGILTEKSSLAPNRLCQTAALLGINKCADWNSRLCIWNAGVGNEKLQATYTNQTLNTLFNYGCRSLTGVSTSWFFDIHSYPTGKNTVCLPLDARSVSHTAPLWITDPPYAGAINYHELADFFIAWDNRRLMEIFNDWYADSKRVLAVRGDDHFVQSMIDIYSNLTAHMPDDGMQIVMFTHSDPAVWAQLALILWKAGLKTTAAWIIATETDAGGLKVGKYVKGTVLLVLRKRTGAKTSSLDEIHTDIKEEVVRQIERMRKHDDRESSDFSDPDYALAAYAASVKVLTSYASITGLDLERECEKIKNDPKHAKVVSLVEWAKKEAYGCYTRA